LPQTGALVVISSFDEQTLGAGRSEIVKIVAVMSVGKA
jgi:hypothetical protein